MLAPGVIDVVIDEHRHPDVRGLLDRADRQWMPGENLQVNDKENESAQDGAHAAPNPNPSHG
jgi:hypothetical protein